MRTELESDEIFLRELKKGYEHQLIVARYLKSKNLKIDVDGLRIRKQKKDIPKFRDEGDLFFINKNNNKIPIEVKSRNVKFTGINDFPYNDIFVDMKTCWDRKEKYKPCAIIMISQLTHAMIVVPVSTKNKWIVKTKKDTIRDYIREYYLVDKKHLKSIDDFISWALNE